MLGSVSVVDRSFLADGRNSGRGAVSAAIFGDVSDGIPDGVFCDSYGSFCVILV